MVKLLRHRQTKGAETARFTLRPPRHIFTLPIVAYFVGINSGFSDGGFVATTVIRVARPGKCLRPAGKQP